MISKIHKLSLQKFKENIHSLSVNDKGLVLNALLKKQQKEWEKKTSLLLSSLSSHSHLFEAGKSLQGRQILQLLHTKKKSHLEKLEPLLLGVNPSEIINMMVAANLQQLKVLQSPELQSSISAQGSHIIEVIAEKEALLTKKLQKIKQEIQQTQATNLTAEALKKIQKEINSCTQEVETEITVLDRCLSIAWYTGNEEMIEEMNQLKEYYRNDLRVGLGHPSSVKSPASGLHLLLESIIASPFTQLHNEAPATEALAALGILTYGELEDMGILKNVPKKMKQRLILSDLSSLSQKTHSIFSTLKLLTVKNFITQKICSSSLLQSYIHSQSIMQIFE